MLRRSVLVKALLSELDIEFRRRMVAQPVFTDVVNVLTPPGFEVPRAEDMIEPTTDSPLSSFDEPAKLLSTVTVKLTIRVGQLFLSSARHENTFGSIPPMTRASSQAFPETRLAVDDILPPCHDASVMHLNLRNVEVSAKNVGPAWRFRD